jgi:hypothetical protein
MPERDPLEALRDQIRAATEAAERLARDAGATDVPPRNPNDIPASGWASPRDDAVAGEVAALANLLGALRELLPAELQQQLAEVIRQTLLLLRALLDWLVSRFEQTATGNDWVVEDIPIA